MNSSSIKLLICLVFIGSAVECGQTSTSALGLLEKIYSHCMSIDETGKCFKIHVLSTALKLLKVQRLSLFEGLSVIKKPDWNVNAIKGLQYSEKELMRLPSEKIDYLLGNTVNKLMESHELQASIPRLLSGTEFEGKQLVEEGRKKMKKYLGPFLAAIALKAGILKMAYHSIAIVAGKALIIGKIALVISAIIGLKKLVSPEGHEKTTYEIVKHPHVQQSHSYSQSHDEYGGSDSASGGQYHRSINDDDYLMQDRVYRAHDPRSTKLSN